jgi:superfamily II DNA/RNA helicase
MSSVQETLTRLLKIELETHAKKLQFIDRGIQQALNYEFLIECLDVLNDLSVKKDERSKRQLIAIAALLWQYKAPSWEGLRNYLILFLSRAGFGPSSIMLDDGYSHETKSYSFSESVLNEFAITVAQANNEIRVGEKKFLLTDFQKSIWNCINAGPLIGISAPTSAGKSFLILLKSIELLMIRSGTVIYVVPTLSLVNQVLADFRKMLDEFNLNDYSLESSFNLSSYSQKSVYVLTQEKAIAAFSQTDIPFEIIRLLVIDEIQNVERVESADDQRAKVLYDLMMEFRNTARIDHIIISGPRINNIDELGGSIFGLEAIKRETNSSPVLNLTYSISRKGNLYYFNVFSDLLQRPLELKITETDAVKGYGKVQYQEDYLNYLDDLVKNFEQECVLIFSPTSSTCSKITEHLTLKSFNDDNEELDGLAQFIGTTVHPQYALVESIKKGIAYHHGKLPFHVRLLVEDAIKAGKIKTIVATTTLLQGVNLPVQNIIIRNPNLFVKKREGSVKLSNYELANLRGRAGRLLKDFVGRTFILDEQSFREPESTQLELFKGTEKELEVGYGRKYNDHKKDIKKDILENRGSTEANQQYNYLTTYLRQAILRYGINSQTYLAKVGIILSDKELNDMIASLRDLRVDKKICAHNRYWDPVDLNQLFLNQNKYILPTSPSEFNISYKLKDILLFLQDQFSAYYSRYFDVYNGEKDILLQKCILADQWLREWPLANILSNSYYNNTERIEDAISFLEGKISYGLALLLKPLYDIKEPESIFPRFVEMGAYLPMTRRLIELNIPRETAIYLNRNFNFPESDNKKELISHIRAIRNRLPYWYETQLKTL